MLAFMVASSSSERISHQLTIGTTIQHLLGSLMEGSLRSPMTTLSASS